MAAGAGAVDTADRDALLEKCLLTDVIYYQTPTTILYDIPKLVLLDEDMNVIRDDIDGGCGTIPVPTFRNGMMPIQTDSILWYGSVKGATGNGKYGLIDTTGQYVSRNDFGQIEWRDSRYMGKRGGRESVVESPWSTLTIYNNEGLLSVIISN